MILQFVKAEREKIFKLYVQVLQNVMKYIFALNHYNYARWLSVHIHDLQRISVVFPDVYNEFLSGNFVLQKTTKPFSAIAIDQWHEQNNAVIKDVGGAVGILMPDMDLMTPKSYQWTPISAIWYVLMFDLQLTSILTFKWQL